MTSSLIISGSDGEDNGGWSGRGRQLEGGERRSGEEEADRQRLEGQRLQSVRNGDGDDGAILSSSNHNDKQVIFYGYQPGMRVI